MLSLYVALLGALALFTAYTRNFQRTVVELAERLGAVDGALLMPRAQRLRTMAVLAGWPVAVGIGMMFVAWWKAVALMAGAYLVLVPVLGSLTPRPGSAHYLARIRADLARRRAAGGHDAADLDRVLARLDAGA